VVIAIDGPGGVGKSTVSRAVADALGFAYLDTGSYYRAVTLATLEAGVAADEIPAVLEIARAADLDFIGRSMFLNGENVSDGVRTPEVTAAVSPISAIKVVRVLVVDRQREWVHRHDGRAVVEGRDIGTVVFPEAPVKVFLTADPAVRATRRSLDAEAAGMAVTEIARALERRDQIDSTRDVSPLVAADDAVGIDTTHLTVDEVVSIILSLAALAGEH